MAVLTLYFDSDTAVSRACSVHVCGGLSVTMGGAVGSGVLRGCGMIAASLLVPSFLLVHSSFSQLEIRVNTSEY